MGFPTISMTYHLMPQSGFELMSRDAQLLGTLIQDAQPTELPRHRPLKVNLKGAPAAYNLLEKIRRHNRCKLAKVFMGKIILNLVILFQNARIPRELLGS